MHYDVYKTITSLRCLLQKSVNASFVNITFFCCLQGVSKNNPTKNRIDAEIQVTLKHPPAQKLTEKKMLSRLSKQVTKINYKLQLLSSECVFRNFCYMDYLLLLLF